ncbi:MAG: spore coat associated protein CotJA [Oscillospiraceae bacterium]|nr:spore coat associated protein CotJA [Oscillospiraceae bacterium]
MYNYSRTTNENRSIFPEETPLGMCYVPFQQWETPYAENTALEQGTMFPSLVMPFCGKESCDNARQ